MSGKVQLLTKIIKETFILDKLKDDYVKPNSFVRNRVLNFFTTVVFILQMLRKTLSIEINNFVFISNTIASIPLEKFTKSAFVQRRSLIHPAFFKKLYKVLIERIYKCNELNLRLWHGFRVLIIDGSTINLPNTKDLGKVYGRSENQNGKSRVQGRMSVLLDMLNGFVIDSILSPLKQTERALALKHLSWITPNDLLVLDRGYPGFEFFDILISNGVNFISRVPRNFNKVIASFVNSKSKDKIVEFRPSKNTNYPKDYSIKLRIIKGKIKVKGIKRKDNEKLIIIVTTLLDSKKYKRKEILELYKSRWEIETYYNEVKNKLQIGIFSGYSQIAIEQDFYASFYISNIKTLIFLLLEGYVRYKTRGRKLDYKINSNVAYGLLKNGILLKLFLLSITPKELIEITKYLIPIRKNRIQKSRTKRRKLRLVKPSITYRSAI